jgi:hypothetical protein
MGAMTWLKMVGGRAWGAWVFIVRQGGLGLLAAWWFLALCDVWSGGLWVVGVLGLGGLLLAGWQASGGRGGDGR